MKTLAVLTFLGVIAIGLCNEKGSIVNVPIQKPALGAWIERAHFTDPKYRLLAKFAIDRQKFFVSTHYSVIRVLRVQTQVVSGKNYKLIFLMGPRKCLINSGNYNSAWCNIKGNNVPKTCTAIIHVAAGNSKKRLASFSCLKRCQSSRYPCPGSGVVVPQRIHKN
uniref:Putative tick cistatins 1 n=1 Tax=Amblyomma cajennense TaxID=34607 RepID=A0A023FQC5_AMBCJ